MSNLNISINKYYFSDDLSKDVKIARLIPIILHELAHLKISKFYNSGNFCENTPEKIYDFIIDECSYDIKT